MLRLVVLFLTVPLFAAVMAAQQQSNYPPTMPGAEVETYKTAGDVEMRVWIFKPDGHSAADRRPAIILFFGGGFRSGTPQQFLHQGKYLASRGMVAVAADYRVSTRHGVKAVSCVEDARDAMRWLRANAARLGVDPKRVAAGGGSAGGYLAAALATLPDPGPRDGSAGVSSVPDALVLYNPGLVIARIPGQAVVTPERAAGYRERFGAEPEDYSPYHHVKKGQAPAIVFHGKADTTVPYATAEAFCKEYERVGNRCELVGYDGAVHGFFNYGRDGGHAYYDTVRRTDVFLESLGWLEGAPAIQEP